MLPISFHAPAFGPALWRRAGPFGVALLGLVAAASARADVYRWVDAQGRVQLSDAVPERYQKSAVRIDTRRSELSEAQRAEVAARRSRQQAQDLAADARRTVNAPATAPSAEPLAEAQAGTASLSKPRTVPGTPDVDCERQWRDYFDSQSCFAPYFTDQGVRGEAFSRCKEVENPSQRCGPAKNPPVD